MALHDAADRALRDDDRHAARPCHAGSKPLSAIRRGHRAVCDRLQPRDARAHVGRGRHRGAGSGPLLGAGAVGGGVLGRGTNSAFEPVPATMKVVERYLVLELLKAFLMMGAALIVLFDLFSFLAETEDIGDGTYEAGDALLVTLYTSPARLTDLAPFVGLLGTVYALSLLTASHEVVALRSVAVAPQ